MKVRTSLFLLSAILAILVVTLGFMVLYTSDLTNREVRESDAASKIIKDIFELNIVTYEYLMHHEERMHQQWLLKYDSLGNLLEGMRKEEMHPEHLSRLESITSDYESLGDFFSQLQANFAKRERLIEDNEPQAEIDLSLASEKRLTAQALMRSQRIASEAFEWSAITQQRIARVQQRTNSIVLFSVIGFAILSFCVSFLTTRAITGPLNKLVRSAEIIGKGNLKHRVDIKTRNEIGELAAAFNQMTERRQRAEEKIEHLNLVLRAIRHVNQLIVRERDRDRLLQGACDNLIETRGYYNAWIALLDESENLVTYAEAGLGDDFMPMVELLKSGEPTYCGRKALDRSGVLAIKDPISECAECPLSGMYAGQGGMSMRLEHGGKVYGLMTVSLSSTIASDEEEQDLFNEVAGDIAFALHNMEVEEARKRAEEALKEYSERLEEMVEERTAELAIAKGKAEEADRLKSVFLATMSHELRTPLNSIIGFTGIVLQGLAGELNEEQKKQLSMVSGSAKHLLALINDILDISKIEAGQIELAPSEFHVSALIQEVVKTLTPMAETKGLEMIVSISPQVGEIHSDRRRVEQILVNLVNNAIKFTEQGEVRIEAQIVDGHLQVSVQDTGIGIKEEDMGKLFQPFRQIDDSGQRRHEGTGLGLSICKRLLDLLGGQIWAESEVGQGSSFTVRLPLRSEQQEA